MMFLFTLMPYGQYYRLVRPGKFIENDVATGLERDDQLAPQPLPSAALRKKKGALETCHPVAVSMRCNDQLRLEREQEPSSLEQLAVGQRQPGRILGRQHRLDPVERPIDADLRIVPQHFSK